MTTTKLDLGHYGVEIKTDDSLDDAKDIFDRNYDWITGTCPDWGALLSLRLAAHNAGYKMRTVDTAFVAVDRAIMVGKSYVPLDNGVQFDLKNVGQTAIAAPNGAPFNYVGDPVLVFGIGEEPFDEYDLLELKYVREISDDDFTFTNVSPIEAGYIVESDAS